MPRLRSFPASLSRPSIHELTTSLLFPQSITCFARQGGGATSRLSQRPIPLSSTTQPRVKSRINCTSSQHFSTSSPSLSSSPKPKTLHRGPTSQEDTQTDFGTLNVLGNTPAPSTSIDACLWDGFHLNSGVRIVGGSGCLLVAGEAFEWRPWEADDGTGSSSSSSSSKKWLVNAKGQFEVADDAWGLLGLVWPKPDLLILGVGKEMRPISPKSRQYINGLGIRIDVQDTRNAAAQFNLLSTERGVGSVAAALIPLGWKEGEGVK